MFRLGIIGSDNSHAVAFSKLANLEEGVSGLRVPDVRVTHLYGTDAARTKEVAEQGKIPNIVTSTEEMLGQVDGVLCVWRHGDKHLPDTLPFIKAGLPAFVDKPLACRVDDAQKLIDAAQKAKVGLTSFSTLRFASPTVKYIEELRSTAGPLAGGACTGPADLNSEYGGIFFYGIHTVELMNAVFGYGCESVSAVEHNKNVVVTCPLRDGPIVVLNMLHPDNAKYVFHVVAFGKEAWRAHEVDSSTCYYEGMNTFMEVLRTGKWNFSPEELLEPVRVLSAIEKSLKKGHAVEV